MSSDNTFTGWQKDSSGNMKRTLNYTVTINNPLIGKFSAVTEYQVRLMTVEMAHACPKCLIMTLNNFFFFH